MTRKAKWRTMLAPRTNVPTNGHTEPEPVGYPVTFDAQDGRKRIIVAVDPNGQFCPVTWFGMHPAGDDNGFHEAAAILAHASLIMAEQAWRLATEHTPVEATNGDDS